ncbi:MAG: hypothetical protein K8I27_13775 [Planctomycetes bacterium]|nr:hypothetical protein [Planctomycetota bacterium]
MVRTFLLCSVLALVAAPAFAQVKVGDDVPEFTPRNLINTPSYRSFSELKGDVILIKAWGKN